MACCGYRCIDRKSHRRDAGRSRQRVPTCTNICWCHYDWWSPIRGCALVVHSASRQGEGKRQGKRRRREWSFKAFAVGRINSICSGRMIQQIGCESSGASVSLPSGHSRLSEFFSFTGWDCMFSARLQRPKSRSDASRLSLLKTRNRQASDRALWNQSNLRGNDLKVSCYKIDQHNERIMVSIPCGPYRSLLKAQILVISMSQSKSSVA